MELGTGGRVSVGSVGVVEPVTGGSVSVGRIVPVVERPAQMPAVHPLLLLSSFEAFKLVSCKLSNVEIKLSLAVLCTSLGCLVMFSRIILVIK